MTSKCCCYTCTAETESANQEMETFEPMANLMSEQDKLGMVWVDTVGWDDAELRDDNTFKEILSFIG